MMTASHVVGQVVVDMHFEDGYKGEQTRYFNMWAYIESEGLMAVWWEKVWEENYLILLAPPFVKYSRRSMDKDWARVSIVTPEMGGHPRW